MGAIRGQIKGWREAASARMIEQGTYPGKVCFASSGTLSDTAH
jgi:hypothetical protein